MAEGSGTDRQEEARTPAETGVHTDTGPKFTR